MPLLLQRCLALWRCTAGLSMIGAFSKVQCSLLRVNVCSVSAARVDYFCTLGLDPMHSDCGERPLAHETLALDGKALGPVHEKSLGP